MFEARAQVTAQTTGVARDHHALSRRHAEQGHGAAAADEGQEARAQEACAQLAYVDVTLGGDIGRRDQPLQSRPEAQCIQVSTHAEGEQAGGTAIVEAAAARVREGHPMPIPEACCGARKKRTHGRVRLGCSGRRPLSEQLVEALVIERADGAELQLQQERLARVGVDGHDLGTGERVVQGIAAGAGDDQNAVAGHEIERGAIDRGILQHWL